MFDTIWGFLLSLILYNVYPDVLMYKFRAAGMSIVGISIRFAPISVIGISIYFGLLEGISRLIAKFLIHPLHEWLKKKKMESSQKVVHFV